MIFGSLREELRDQIVEICRIVSLKKGAYLFREGDLSKGFYIVNRGAVSLHKISSEGDQQVLKIFSAGESFGEATVISFTRYPANARAECDTMLVRVDKAEIQRLARANEQIAQCLAIAVAGHLKHLVSHMEDRAFLSPESRVAKWISSQSVRGAFEAAYGFEMEAPKRCVADELGMASETFSRKLRALKDKGLIEVSKKQIRVVNPVGLNKIVELGD